MQWDDTKTNAPKKKQVDQVYGPQHHCKIQKKKKKEKII